MIEKGTSLRMQEFDEDIAKAITKAQLPPRVIEIIFTDYANAMKQANIQVVEMERKAFKEGGKQDGVREN